MRPERDTPSLGWLLITSLAMGCSLSSDRLDGTPSGVSGPGFEPSPPTMGGSSDHPEACQDFTLEADQAAASADVIFAVDTSGSMSEESAFVQQQLNAFSAQIGSADIDLQVIMLGDICIAPPLGSGACPADQNLPDYLHPPALVGSNDALSIIVEGYGSYAAQLRSDARKHVVVITDDDAMAPHISDAGAFIAAFTALNPESLTDFTAHGVYCFAAGGACTSEGTAYHALVNLTGGVHGNLALQDFGPIFDVLAEKIVADGHPLPCVVAIPKPPDDKVLDTDSVTLTFVDGADDPLLLIPVPSQSTCSATSGGWTFDDDDSPTSIHLCPSSCALVSSAPAGKLMISLSCDDLPSPG